MYEITNINTIGMRSNETHTRGDRYYQVCVPTTMWYLFISFNGNGNYGNRFFIIIPPWSHFILSTKNIMILIQF